MGFAVVEPGQSVGVTTTFLHKGVVDLATHHEDSRYERQPPQKNCSDY
ncbi:MAG: hypothetical protein F6K35_35385 [Okeania sp. SIO2H7]|nr:hypothetical protein [Okeania sp. SIO2H7]